jgi:hypothetical protein
VAGTRSGADLIRQALAVAQTDEQRKVAEQAAASAVREVTELLHRQRDEPAVAQLGAEPIVYACQRVIRELHAATSGITLTPADLSSLPAAPRKRYATALAKVGARAAEVVSRQLALPPGA